MSFRQANKSPGTMWRKKHRAELLAAGVPDFLVDDDRRWTYVLFHGDDELGSGWTPDRITKPQAKNLLDVLQQHYENTAGLELFAALKKRIKD